MTQHTNRVSQQDAIPRARTALPVKTAQQRGGCVHRGRRIWDAGFEPTGMSCQPCCEGKTHILVYTAGLYLKHSCTGQAEV